MQGVSQLEEFQTVKVYCANCFYCKLLPTESGNAVLRIRCAAGKWKKKLGQEKVYKYCTISRRFQDFCDSYDEMGETTDYIRELRKIVTEEANESAEK